MLAALTVRPSAEDDKVWPGYDSVKKWTKAVDVFQQDLIIVPVNENLHWYLAVIYNPRALIEPRSSSGSGCQSTPQTTSVSTSEPSRATSASAESAMKDRDPLDVMSEGEEEPTVEQLQDKVDDCHISPKPIQSMELDWIVSQDQPPTFSPPPKTPSPVKPKSKFLREAHDLRGSQQ